MSDQILKLPADSANTGKLLDTSELTVGPNVVERERINIADPGVAAAIAAVLNGAPTGNEYALVVRAIIATLPMLSIGSQSAGLAMDSTLATLAKDSTVAKDATVTALSGKTPTLTGVWAYHAGASGTVVVPAGERVIGIAAHSTAGGTMTINSGDSIPVPANAGIAIQPIGNVTAPTIVLTGTDSYFIETLH